MPIIDTSASPLPSREGAKFFGIDKNGNYGWLYLSINEDSFIIGTPGTQGFGVGVCPPQYLPDGMSPLVGYNDVTSDNYGNYQYEDGSICVFIPKFFYRIGSPDSTLFGVHGNNAIDIVGTETFLTRSHAELEGWNLHRAFIDGGIEQPGFFVDKYDVSLNPKGTGYVASSIKNGLPLSTASAHNPIASVTSSPSNNYFSFIDAAKGRSGTNGALDNSSPWHCLSAFQMSALAILSLAHGQSSTGTAYCAWWTSTGVSAPRGNNNNALRDTDDPTVIYVSDGYPNCGRTGSGTPFNKTTHNGQNCGVSDLNGNMFKVLIGTTCVGGAKAISGITKASTCVVTATGHGLVSGTEVVISGVVGMTQLNDKLFTITTIDENTFSLDGVDSSSYGAYTSGGTIYYGTFYAAKESVRMAEFTSGNSTANSHWGAVGVSNMMDPVDYNFNPPLGGISINTKFGNGTNQVLSNDSSGTNGYILTSLGLPKDESGSSSGGSELFGNDYYSRLFRNELCLIGAGYWGFGAVAGVFSRYLGSSRSNSYVYVGGRFACYPVE